MLNKLFLIPALLLSVNAFSNDEQSVCVEQCEETKTVAENCTEATEAAEEVEAVTACSDVRSAFALESLLKVESIQQVYSALDESQKTRFEVMMNELSTIVEEATSKTQSVMDNNKDIRDVWNTQTNGKTRFVLSAGFENDQSAN